jgi:hypothetical protein
LLALNAELNVFLVLSSAANEPVIQLSVYFSLAILSIASTPSPIVLPSAKEAEIVAELKRL